MRASSFHVLALALTGCLALVNHPEPWPCTSDADCDTGQTCQLAGGVSGTCLAASGGDAGATEGGKGGGGNGNCCMSVFGGDCQCYAPQKITCESSPGCGQRGQETCSCRISSSPGNSGQPDTCSLPTLPWTACCLDLTDYTCNCYPSGGCNSFETSVASCSASMVQAQGIGCQISVNGVCSCSFLSGSATACASALQAVCCQSESECSCGYDLECLSGEQQVPSCSAAALTVPPVQCPLEMTPVGSCP